MIGGNNVQYHQVRPYIPPIQLIKTPSQNNLISQITTQPISINQQQPNMVNQQKVIILNQQPNMVNQQQPNMVNQQQPIILNQQKAMESKQANMVSKQAIL